MANRAEKFIDRCTRALILLLLLAVFLSEMAKTGADLIRAAAWEVSGGGDTWWWPQHDDEFSWSVLALLALRFGDLLPLAVIGAAVAQLLSLWLCLLILGVCALADAVVAGANELWALGIGVYSTYMWGQAAALVTIEACDAAFPWAAYWILQRKRLRTAGSNGSACISRVGSCSSPRRGTSSSVGGRSRR